MADALLHRLRVLLKRAVPRPLHGAATRALTAVAPLALRGDAVECPCCGGRFRRFLTYPSLFCPRCGSYERHRALCLFLRRRPELLEPPLRLLHVAPEAAIERKLRGRPGVDYVSIDLEYRLAMHLMDVTDMTFEDESFDLVLCLHVLDSVEDEAAALRELFRVTRGGGRALVQLPVHLQPPDFPQRLEAVGWSVETLAPSDELGPEAVALHGLQRGELVYLCRRPAA